MENIGGEVDGWKYFLFCSLDRVGYRNFLYEKGIYSMEVKCLYIDFYNL